MTEKDIIVRALHLLLGRLHFVLAGVCDLSLLDWVLLEDLTNWWENYER